jgi:hypothetical protein
MKPELWMNVESGQDAVGSAMHDVERAGARVLKVERIEDLVEAPTLRRVSTRSKRLICPVVLVFGGSARFHSDPAPSPSRSLPTIADNCRKLPGINYQPSATT